MLCFSKRYVQDKFSDYFFLVIPLGLEPRAHTLKVYCSTN